MAGHGVANAVLFSELDNVHAAGDDVLMIPRLRAGVVHLMLKLGDDTVNRMAKRGDEGSSGEYVNVLLSKKMPVQDAEITLNERCMLPEFVRHHLWSVVACVVVNDAAIETTVKDCREARSRSLGYVYRNAKGICPFLLP